MERESSEKIDMKKSKQNCELHALVGKRVRIERRGSTIEGTLKGKRKWKDLIPPAAAALPEIEAAKIGRDGLWQLEAGADKIHFAADDGWVVTPIA